MASDAGAIADHLRTLAAYPGHWPGIAFSNHDVTRTVSRFGPGSAKVMLALLFAMRGSILLYQGEELGLPEVDLARDQLRDPVGDLYYPLFKGRDGCRTPMPWDAGLPHLGFTTGTPWLPLGESHAALAVAAQEKDPASPLAYTRQLLAARKAHAALRNGGLTLLDASPPLLAFLRDDILCVFNLDRQTLSWAHPALAGKTTLDFGTGTASLAGDRLTLGPLAAWFGQG
jgi:alpha-glucosidase